MTVLYLVMALYGQSIPCKGAKADICRSDVTYSESRRRSSGRLENIFSISYLLTYRHHGEKVSIIMATNENIKEQPTPEAVTENDADDDFDFAESFNRRGRLFTIDTEGMEGHKASEVFKEIGDAPLIMKAIFINKDTGYGESVSVVTNNSVIYFSKANLEAAHNIRDNQKAVDKINEKGAFFRITEFEAKKYKKKGYSFEFLKKSEIPAEFTGDEPCFKW